MWMNPAVKRQVIYQVLGQVMVIALSANICAQYVRAGPGVESEAESGAGPQ